MATSPGPTRVINIDPPDEIPPYILALGNHHWGEELPLMNYAEGRSMFCFDLDMMEKGLLEENHDQEKSGEHVLKMKDHSEVYNGLTVVDRFRHCVSSLAAGFFSQVPQNTQDWLWTGQGSSTGDCDASVNLLEGNRDIDGKDGTYMSEVLTAPLEALGEMGRPALELMNQRYAEVIVSPSYWPVFARKMISEVLSSDDTSYGSPSSGSIALLLEKAILNWNAAPRYVGLYPHSADPPIHITEIVAEYPPQYNRYRNNTTNPITFARPARPPNSYHHHHHHRSLRGAHAAPKLAESFLTSVLQVVKALGPLILTALLRVPLIGRIYKKVVPARYRTGLNKHTKIINTRKNPGTPPLRIMESITPTLECNALTLDPEFQEWLDVEQIDLTLYNFDEGLGSSAAPTPAEEPQVPTPSIDPIISPGQIVNPDPAYITDLTQLHPELVDSIAHQMIDINPAYITDFSQLPHYESAYTIDFSRLPYSESAYTIDFSQLSYSESTYTIDSNQYIQYSPTNAFEQFRAPTNFPNNFSYTPPSHTPSSVYDNSDWLNFVSLSGYSTPSLSEHTDCDNMEISYMDTNPGLSIPTSQNATPQTAGLETPTFTPSCSPVSVTSPPQQLPRRYSCEYESCGHKEFDRPCDLNKHLKTHNKHLECDFDPNGGCQMKFSTEKDRKRHKVTVHEKQRPHVCHICVKEGAEGKEGRFSRKDNLKIHIKKVHGVD